MSRTIHHEEIGLSILSIGSRGKEFTDLTLRGSNILAYFQNA
jgi:hypothetical protein